MQLCCAVPAVADAPEKEEKGGERDSEKDTFGVDGSSCYGGYDGPDGELGFRTG